MGFGSSAYGSESYGGGLPSIELSAAQPLDTNTVRVTLTSQALALSGFAIGDALNPSTWTVLRLDTGAVFTVLAVRAIAIDTYDIFVLETFGDSKTTHSVGSTTLLTPSGVLVGPIKTFNFLGVLDSDFSKPVAATSQRRYPSRDIANPPFPTTNNSVAGGFVTTSSGDVALDEGVALLRKLILRRLTTPLGGFFHLPKYGFGFDVKNPVQGTGDMVRLKQRIEKDLLNEPELEKVIVNMEQRADLGILVIKVSAAVKKTGQTIDVESVQG